MPFIGNQPALSYTSFAKQDFTTSATTSYTLDQPVANANELALFINFVRQEPTTAYTASGTTLTLTSATSASDDMYCVFLGKAVQTVNPPSGSVGISQLSATGTKDATTFLRGDNTFAVAGGTNTPNFLALPSADQTISNTTNTTVTFDTEVFDTDNAFASNTFTVPSGKAGKYLFIAQGRITNLNSNSEFQLAFFKNGSSDFLEASQNAYIVQNTYSPDTSASMYFSHSMIANLAESDAITVSIYHNAGASKTLESTYTRFSGFKLIE